MFALIKNDASIKFFTPYSVWEDKNGTKYSPDSLLTLSGEQKQDLGIYDVAYASRPDDRFYNVTENSPVFDSLEKIVKVTYTATSKELEDDGIIKGLKSTWINQIKDTCNKLLAQTDWMIVRKIEREVDVPAGITTYRAAVITEANRLETSITAATTVEELITAVESVNFPTAE